MRILITGGAGFIGSHLTDVLLERGHEVAVFDNFRTGSLDNLQQASKNQRLQVHHADVLEGAKLNSVCQQFTPDTLVHLAALVSVQDARRSPDDNFRLNLEGTHRAASAVIAAKIPRIVFASSAAIYGDNPRIPLSEDERATPVGLYGGAKAASELLLCASSKDYNFDCVSLRFFNVFGPRQRPDSPYSGVISIFADRISRGQPITIYGDGEQTRDFVPVREIAGAIAAVATAPAGLSGTFNVCTGQRTSLRQLVAAFEAAAGRPIQLGFKEHRAGDILHSGGDPTRLAAAVGVRPKSDLVNSLRELMGLSSTNGSNSIS